MITEDVSKHTVCVGDRTVAWFNPVGVGARLRQAVAEVLDTSSAALPARSGASFLLKPNLNNDLCALTGNSTDLRLLAAAIEALQRRGYTNIVVGDGPNIGAYRKGIDVDDTNDLQGETRDEWEDWLNQLLDKASEDDQRRENESTEIRND